MKLTLDITIRRRCTAARVICVHYLKLSYRYWHIKSCNLSPQDLKGLANLPEHQEAGLSVDKFDKARHSAIGAAKSLMMSDAVLLFPPGQLALAALRSGFKSVDSRLDPYLKRVLEKSNIKVICQTVFPRISLSVHITMLCVIQASQKKIFRTSYVC